MVLIVKRLFFDNMGGEALMKRKRKSFREMGDIIKKERVYMWQVIRLGNQGKERKRKINLA